MALVLSIVVILILRILVMEKVGLIKMTKGYSFMNYYCVRRLLEMGYSYYDFVECCVDFDGVVHMFPIGYTWDNMVSFGDDVSMVFLGYSRRRRLV